MAIGNDISATVRGVVLDNLGMKMLALVIALVLYSLVHGAEDAQRSVSINLVMLLPPEGANRVLVNPIPPQVRLTLRGPRTVLDELRADAIGNFQIDLRSGSDSRITLDPGLVHLPPSISVEQVDPPALDLEWEEVVALDVPVRAATTGALPSGFVVKGSPTVDPPKVRVRGPESEVQVLQQIHIDPFDLTGLTEGIYPRHLAIDRPRSRTTVDASSVLVTVHVAREAIERLFAKTLVVAVGVPKARIQPAEVDVRLTCPSEFVKGLRPEQIVPRVEVRSTVLTGSELLPVVLSLAPCDAVITPSEVVVRW